MADRTPTLREVAEHAGVSVATVSLVLNGPGASKGRATDRTRERVLAAAAALGYERNQLARGLRRGRTEQVTVIAQGPSTPWTQTLIADVARVGETHGYSTVAFVSGDWKTHLRRRTSDGAVVDIGWDGLPDLNDLRSSLARGLALVILNNHVEPAGFDVVRANESEACDTAMRFLIDQGRRRIACLRHTPPRVPGQPGARYASYLEALEASELPTDDVLVRDFYGSRERAYMATLDLLDRDHRPDAIFAASDYAAISALWAAHRLGIRVPDDLAIIGVGNAAEGEFTDPPLTTVGPYRVDFTAVAQMLFDRIAGHAPSPGRLHLQQWDFIHRGTA